MKRSHRRGAWRSIAAAGAGIALMGLAADPLSRDLAAMVEAERAFARAAAEKGVRDAFIEFFAEDSIAVGRGESAGVAFINARGALRRQPAAPDPKAVLLAWEPRTGAVARAGDLGYLTGPYTRTDNTAAKRPTRHGCYFSIWRKQQDGSWRVIVDQGIVSPAPVTFAAAGFAPASEAGGRFTGAARDPEGERRALLDEDAAIARDAASAGLADALARRMTADARLHRNGALPITGVDAIRRALEAAARTGTWKPEAADVSRSADLAFTYGTYTTGGSGAAPEQGGYVRMWRRLANGDWRVVLDVTAPIPAG